MFWWTIQNYVIKLGSDLQQVCGFLRVFRFPLLIKLTADITEILLKAALNTNTLTGGCQHNFSEKTCHLIIMLVDTICSTLNATSWLGNIALKTQSKVKEWHFYFMVDRYGILCNKWPRCVPFVVNTSLSFPHSWLITGFVTRLTWRVSLVEQELLTLPKHLSSPSFLVGFVLLDL